MQGRLIVEPPVSAMSGTVFVTFGSGCYPALEKKRANEYRYGQCCGAPGRRETVETVGGIGASGFTRLKPGAKEIDSSRPLLRTVENWVLARTNCSRTKCVRRYERAG